MDEGMKTNRRGWDILRAYLNEDFYLIEFR